MFTRQWPAVAALCLCLCALTPCAGQVTCGGPILISEWHHPAHQPSSVNPGPINLPYLELMSRNRSGTPTDIGNTSITIWWRTAGGTLLQRSLTLPSTFLMPEAANGLPGVLVISPSGQLPIPNASSPLGIPYRLIDNQLFAPGLAQGAPGIMTRISVVSPNTTAGTGPFLDELIIGADPGGSPPSPFSTIAVPQSTGHVNRATYLNNCSGYNYETSQAIYSPGAPNPVQDHVGGFRIGSANLALTPAGATGVSGTFGFNSLSIAALFFPHHPDHPVINDSSFDRVLAPGASLTVSSSSPLTASNFFLENASLPGGMNWNLTVPTLSPTGTDGVLGIQMGALNEAPGSAVVGLNSTSPLSNPLRVERFLTDNQATDAVITIIGDGTEVQIDVSTTSGDVWCDMIVYDGGGNAYEAKVRNWPANPTSCSTPNLGSGTGTPGTGQLNLIAICFDPQAELYLLPSFATATPTGSGLFMGINPDFTTLYALGRPLNDEPFHVTANNDGLYFFTGNFVPLIGTSVDWVAFQFDGTLGAITQVSPAVNVTIL